MLTDVNSMLQIATTQGEPKNAKDIQRSRNFGNPENWSRSTLQASAVSPIPPSWTCENTSHSDPFRSFSAVDLKHRSEPIRFNQHQPSIAIQTKTWERNDSAFSNWSGDGSRKSYDSTMPPSPQQVRIGSRGFLSAKKRLEHTNTGLHSHDKKRKANFWEALCWKVLKLVSSPLRWSQ